MSVVSLLRRDRERIIGCLNLWRKPGTTGERDAAAAALNRLLEARGLGWEEIINRQACNIEQRHEPPFLGWRGDLAACQRAAHNLTEWEQNFVSRLPDFRVLSVKQRRMLDEIALRVLGGANEQRRSRHPRRRGDELAPRSVGIALGTYPHHQPGLQAPKGHEPWQATMVPGLAIGSGYGHANLPRAAWQEHRNTGVRTVHGRSRPRRARCRTRWYRLTLSRPESGPTPLVRSASRPRCCAATERDTNRQTRNARALPAQRNQAQIPGDGRRPTGCRLRTHPRR